MVLDLITKQSTVSSIKSDTGPLHLCSNPPFKISKEDGNLYVWHGLGQAEEQASLTETSMHNELVNVFDTTITACKTTDFSYCVTLTEEGKPMPVCFVTNDKGEVFYTKRKDN